MRKIAVYSSKSISLFTISHVEDVLSGAQGQSISALLCTNGLLSGQSYFCNFYTQDLHEYNV